MHTGERLCSEQKADLSHTAEKSLEKKEKKKKENPKPLGAQRDCMVSIQPRKIAESC